jgi:hypothetical protein
VLSRKLSSVCYMRDSGLLRHDAYQDAFAFIEGHGSVMLWAKGLCGWVGKWSAKDRDLAARLELLHWRLEKDETR